jgi:lysozyme family protein
MQKDFLNCLSRVLVYEGGKVDDPRDPGGRTNQGVTQSTYTAWRRTQGLTPQDVYLMSDTERDTIYEKEFWDQINGGLLPVGLDLVVFDGAVNSGPAQSIKWVQAALSGVTVDGVLGSKTMMAINAIRGANSVDELIQEVCARRLAFDQGLSTWATYGRGWSARIANVQKTAIAWEGSAVTIPAAPDLSGLGGQAKAKAVDIKPPAVSQITANVATAAASAATIASQAAQQVQGFQDTFAWVKYVFGGLTLVGVVAGVVALLASKAHDAVVAGTAKATVDLEADRQLPSLPDVKLALKSA